MIRIVKIQCHDLPVNDLEDVIVQFNAEQQYSSTLPVKGRHPIFNDDVTLVVHPTCKVLEVQVVRYSSAPEEKLIGAGTIDLTQLEMGTDNRINLSLSTLACITFLVNPVVIGSTTLHTRKSIHFQVHHAIVPSASALNSCYKLIESNATRWNVVFKVHTLSSFTFEGDLSVRIKSLTDDRSQSTLLFPTSDKTEDQLELNEMLQLNTLKHEPTPIEISIVGRAPSDELKVLGTRVMTLNELAEKLVHTISIDSEGNKIADLRLSWEDRNTYEVRDEGLLYCVAQCSTTHYRTRVVPYTQATWEESFEAVLFDEYKDCLLLNLYYCPSQEEIDSSILLGKFTLRLERLQRGKTCELRLPLYLQHEGQWTKTDPEINVNVSILPKNFGATGGPQLKIFLDDGSNVRDCTGLITDAAIQPQISFQMNGTTWRSSVAHGTNPSWKETVLFDMPVNSPENSILKLLCSDSNVILGRFQFSCESLICNFEVPLTFHLQTKGSDGVWNSTGASINVKAVALGFGRSPLKLVTIGEFEAKERSEVSLEEWNSRIVLSLEQLNIQECLTRSVLSSKWLEKMASIRKEYSFLVQKLLANQKKAIATKEEETQFEVPRLPPDALQTLPTIRTLWSAAPTVKSPSHSDRNSKPGSPQKRTEFTVFPRMEVSVHHVELPQPWNHTVVEIICNGKQYSTPGVVENTRYPSWSPPVMFNFNCNESSSLTVKLYDMKQSDGDDVNVRMAIIPVSLLFERPEEIVVDLFTFSSALGEWTMNDQNAYRVYLTAKFVNYSINNSIVMLKVNRAVGLSDTGTNLFVVASVGEVKVRTSAVHGDTVWGELFELVLNDLTCHVITFEVFQRQRGVDFLVAQAAVPLERFRDNFKTRMFAPLMVEYNSVWATDDQTALEIEVEPVRVEAPLWSICSTPPTSHVIPFYWYLRVEVLSAHIAHIDPIAIAPQMAVTDIRPGNVFCSITVKERTWRTKNADIHHCSWNEPLSFFIPLKYMSRLWNKGEEARFPPVIVELNDDSSHRKHCYGRATVAVPPALAASAKELYENAYLSHLEMTHNKETIVVELLSEDVHGTAPSCLLRLNFERHLNPKLDHIYIQKVITLSKDEESVRHTYIQNFNMFLFNILKAKLVEYESIRRSYFVLNCSRVIQKLQLESGRLLNDALLEREKYANLLTTFESESQHLERMEFFPRSSILKEESHKRELIRNYFNKKTEHLERDELARQLARAAATPEPPAKASPPHTSHSMNSVYEPKAQPANTSTYSPLYEPKASSNSSYFLYEPKAPVTNVSMQSLFDAPMASPTFPPSPQSAREVTLSASGTQTIPYYPIRADTSPTTTRIVAAPSQWEVVERSMVPVSAPPAVANINPSPRVRNVTGTPVIEISNPKIELFGLSSVGVLLRWKRPKIVLKSNEREGKQSQIQLEYKLLLNNSNTDDFVVHAVTTETEFMLSGLDPSTKYQVSVKCKPSNNINFVCSKNCTIVSFTTKPAGAPSPPTPRNQKRSLAETVPKVNKGFDYNAVASRYEASPRLPLVQSANSARSEARMRENMKGRQHHVPPLHPPMVL